MPLVTDIWGVMQIRHDLLTLTEDDDLALDTETTGTDLYGGDVIRGVSLAYRNQSWYVPVSHPESFNVPPWQARTLAAAINHCLARPIFHNAMFDWRSLSQIGVTPPEWYWDTQVISWMMDENVTHTLKGQAAMIWGEDEKAEQDAIKAMFRGELAGDVYKRLRAEGWPVQAAKMESKELAVASRKTWATLTAADIGEYAAKDAELTLRLCHWQEEQLRRPDQRCDVRPDIDRKFAMQHLLYRMVERGVLVDVEKAKANREAALARMWEIEPHFEGVNLNSPKQLARLIFEEWGLPIGHWTKTGAPSTSREALEELEGAHDGLDLLLEYRKLAKRVGTYYDNLIRGADENGRVHPGYCLTCTVTGRLSSRSPNLMNLPRDDTDPEVKTVFVAPEGMELVEFDLKSAELFVGASVAQDWKMLETLTEEGRDFHTETAMSVFGSTDGSNRTLAKNLNYGCVPYTTPILCGDLQWRPAGQLQVGDRLLAFDESGPWRRWCWSTVTANTLDPLPTVEVDTDDGIVTSSADHPWLVRPVRGAKTLTWVQARDLQPGDQIVVLVEPWEQADTFADGYVAGILDGEGWLSHAANNHSSVAFAQLPGAVLEATLGHLRRRGYRMGVFPKGKESCVMSAVVQGGRPETLRVLGQYQPHRLVAKFTPGMMGLVRAVRYRTVQGVRDVPDQIMARLGTTSKTYVADGMPAHNTPYGIGPTKFATYVVKGTGRAVRVCQRCDEEHGRRLGPGERCDVCYSRKLIARHRMAWPKTHLAIDRLTAFARQHGYLPLAKPGRFRHFRSPGRIVPYYSAFNGCVQGGVADTMTDVMLEVEQPAADMGAAMVLQVHDSLWFYAEPGTADALLALLQETLDRVNPYTARLTWDRH